MSQFDFENILSSSLEKLSQSRPVFHIEADFQHALAWQIQTDFPQLDIRFEYKPQNISDRMFVDLWIKDESGNNFAIELKYKTRKFEETVHDEKFKLMDQSAQDLGRYDYLKDVERLEKIVSNHKNTIGFAIILTNDSGYWNTPQSSDTVDANYRIFDGKTIHGKLEWAEHASSGTTSGRTKPLEILGDYFMDWKDYSQIGDSNRGKLRYLKIKVSGNYEYSKKWHSNVQSVKRRDSVDL